jgi:excinuclease ABC subunit C
MFDIKSELTNAPDLPGIYMMKDDGGQIIYIGKAKNLKKRVKQYFQSKNHAYKIQKMIEGIFSFEYIITDSEIEALILESTLIKKHKPRYNTRLTDDKTYPYIKVTIKEKFPRVFKVREISQDGNKYFGPYTSALAVKQTIESIRNIFKIRDCNLKISTGKENSRPCLNYYINRCNGPCIGKITSAQYMEAIHKVLDLLNGKEEELIRELEKRMVEASDNLLFEHAATYRDQIEAIRNLGEKQKVSRANFKDIDIIGVASGESDAIAQIFFVRSGKITGREDYLLSVNLEDSPEEIIGSFIKQYYTGTVYIPKEIFIERELEDMELITSWLSELRGNRVLIKVPQKGENSMLMKMVRKNAEEKLNKDVNKIKTQKEENITAASELAGLIGLDRVPLRIEAFDISNIQGLENVGSMVVYEDGEPKKSDYRRFRIKNVYGQDDYKSMEEIIDRRINRGLIESSLDGKQKTFNQLPDLILVDGGKGHVSIVEETLKSYGLMIPVCGMVKDDRHITRGLIYKKKEVMLLRNTKLYRLVSSIQNEAHRFAISYHRNLRKKNVLKTILDDIIGIGEKRKLSLLNTFGSVEGISNATIEELQKAPSMNKLSAIQVFEFFEKTRG